MSQLILAAVFILQQFLSIRIGAYGFSDAIYVHSWLNKGCRWLSFYTVTDKDWIPWNADKVAIVIISQQCKLHCHELLWHLIICNPIHHTPVNWINYSNNVPLITYIHTYYGIIEAICPLLMAPLFIYGHLTATYGYMTDVFTLKVKCSVANISVYILCSFLSLCLPENPMYCIDSYIL